MRVLELTTGELIKCGAKNHGILKKGMMINLSEADLLQTEPGHIVCAIEVSFKIDEDRMTLYKLPDSMDEVLQKELVDEVFVQSDAIAKIAIAYEGDSAQKIWEEAVEDQLSVVRSMLVRGGLDEVSDC